MSGDESASICGSSGKLDDRVAARKLHVANGSGDVMMGPWVLAATARPSFILQREASAALPAEEIEELLKPHSKLDLGTRISVGKHG